MIEKSFRIKIEACTPSMKISKGDIKKASEWAKIWPELDNGQFNSDWFDEVIEVELRPIIYTPQEPFDKRINGYSVVIHVHSKEEAELIYNKIDEVLEEYKIFKNKR